MNFYFFFFLIASTLATIHKTDNIQPAGPEANGGQNGIDWKQVDPACTISCGAYWLCVVRVGKGCSSPSGCVCEKFAGTK